MMRNKTSSSLQKTYDECYLHCSTAVFFEGKGNEQEALRSWREGLDKIYYHNAYRVPAGYVPKSETEKALKDSLGRMEIQCKERVDLLVALKASREEAAGGKEEGSGVKITKSAKPTPRPSEERQRGDGFIGDGTIPAESYEGISRPSTLPQRPALVGKNSAEMAVVGKGTGYGEGRDRMSSAPVASSSSGTHLAPKPMKKSSRSPSPEKRHMLHTLRSSDRMGRKPVPKPPRNKDNPVTNKAASLAWQSLGRRDRLGRSLDAEQSGSSNSLVDSRKESISDPTTGRPGSGSNVRYDSKTRTLVPDRDAKNISPTESVSGKRTGHDSSLRPSGYPFPPTASSPASASARNTSGFQEFPDFDSTSPLVPDPSRQRFSPPPPHINSPAKLEPLNYPTYLKEYPETSAKKIKAAQNEMPSRRKPKEAQDGKKKLPIKVTTSSRHRDRHQERDEARRQKRRSAPKPVDEDASSQSVDDNTASSDNQPPSNRKLKAKDAQKAAPIAADLNTPSSDTESETEKDQDPVKTAWDLKVASLMKNLPKGVDEKAASQIFNEIVVHGDEVHWDDVAGLDIAKNALKEAVVYPFLRPDLFMGLREPARGMLLFGPPGTGKTMLARAVATESRSTFFSISSSSLISKWLGESEKLVRALFALAKALAPSIIFVDEIDSLLSSRGEGEHESTRRIKTEFLIQWSDLQRAAAGREQSEKEKREGDASRVLVLAATNLPWAIDEAARRRFVRRQYIPLPEGGTRGIQLRTLLGHQKHSLEEADIEKLISLTNGFSGSDITALAKDAAMGPLRSLGEKLLQMSMEEIRPIELRDFEASLGNIRASVSKEGLKLFEEWAREFGERGG
ncbi:hypothetical protein HYALB_00006533 [Hymenoscyphus albidus]|uniref:AAA+ ATPase domain-containing protein n=1 Tax=Hymenoscyphus albidus TaxID=595503 RepID=A0A9N9Q1B5_9HELO|nr:hypothetical protein HYALB_00006533 [Hymenoscyphus albidus]